MDLPWKYFVQIFYFRIFITLIQNQLIVILAKLSLRFHLRNRFFFYIWKLNIHFPCSSSLFSPKCLFMNEFIERVCDGFLFFIYNFRSISFENYACFTILDIFHFFCQYMYFWKSPFFKRRLQVCSGVAFEILLVPFNFNMKTTP